MWYDESVIYQIYPLGFCGAEAENPSAPVSEDLWESGGKGAAPKQETCGAGTAVCGGEGGREAANAGASGETGVMEAGRRAEQSGACAGDGGAEQGGRILRLLDFIPHIKACGFDTVLLNPLFESDRHGYDTRNFRIVDRRLGTNAEFKAVTDALHAAGIRVLLDGVFNHAGRGFFAFQDVLKRRWESPYRDWFHISFDGNSPYNDGLWYEGWEGHYELVKLNLKNPAVIQYLFDSVRYWVETFGIDGLRLDVAYCLDLDFLRALRRFTKELKPEFFLLGEMLHGDYNQRVNAEMLDSCTNYECYKGLYSSFNSMNLFEIGYSLNRQFGPEQWTLYRGKHLLAFADNHDVTRLASILTNPAHVRPLYGLMFGMPGIPCVYYGSEWGAAGEKAAGDAALRPAFERPEENELTDWIRALAKAHRESRALCYGAYRQLAITNRQLVFERETEGERVIVAVNADAEWYTAHFDARAGRGIDLITGEMHDFGGGSALAPYSAAYWRTEC